MLRPRQLYREFEINLELNLVVKLNQLAHVFFGGLFFN